MRQREKQEGANTRKQEHSCNLFCVFARRGVFRAPERREAMLVNP
jgi:hypothetical protein